MNRPSALAIATLLVAMIAVAIGVLALTQKPATASGRSPYVRLEKEVRGLRLRLESEASTLTEINKLKGTVGKITTCLPELNGQIEGLVPEVTGGNVWLQQHSQISRYCHSILTGE